MSDRQPAAGQGSIFHYLANDHLRLDALLRAAVADPSHVDHASYDQFRAGLLRHIGMEEKILLPAIQHLRGGAVLPIAAKLRLDHGALAALLVPSPKPAIIAAIRAILSAHNHLEEGPDGLYETCGRLVDTETDAIVARLRAVPEVTAMSHSDSPAVMHTVHRTVARAGYDFNDF